MNHPLAYYCLVLVGVLFVVALVELSWLRETRTRLPRATLRKIKSARQQLWESLSNRKEQR